MESPFTAFLLPKSSLLQPSRHSLRFHHLSVNGKMKISNQLFILTLLILAKTIIINDYVLWISSPSSLQISPKTCKCAARLPSQPQFVLREVMLFLQIPPPLFKVIFFNSCYIKIFTKNSHYPCWTQSRFGRQVCNALSSSVCWNSLSYNT